MTNPTAERILKSAHRLLIARGYAGFSYAGIARDLRISKPAMHHHFPTKVDLGVAVVQRYREHVGHMLTVAAGQGLDPRAQLLGYFDYWRDCLRQPDAPLCVCAMLAAGMPALPEVIRMQVSAHFAELLVWLTSVIAAGQQDGSLACHGHADQQAARLMALVHGGMLAARALRSPEAFDVAVDQTLTQLT